MAKVRVSIPANVQEAIELAGIVRAKHEADGETSPLKTLQDKTGPKCRLSWTLAIFNI